MAYAKGKLKLYHIHDDDLKNRSRSAQTAARKRRVLAIEKLERGCEGPNCQWQGDFISSQLEFDHIDPKTKDMKENNFANMSWDKMFVEIEKCQVLCSNCHKVKTFGEDIDKWRK